MRSGGVSGGGRRSRAPAREERGGGEQVRFGTRAVQEEDGRVHGAAAADYETRCARSKGSRARRRVDRRWRVERCRERLEARRGGGRLWRYEGPTRARDCDVRERLRCRVSRDLR